MLLNTHILKLCSFLTGSCSTLFPMYCNEYLMIPNIALYIIHLEDCTKLLD